MNEKPCGRKRARHLNLQIGCVEGQRGSVKARDARPIRGRVGDAPLTLSEEDAPTAIGQPLANTNGGQVLARSRFGDAEDSGRLGFKLQVPRAVRRVAGWRTHRMAGGLLALRHIQGVRASIHIQELLNSVGQDTRIHRERRGPAARQRGQEPGGDVFHSFRDHLPHRIGSRQHRQFHPVRILHSVARPIPQIIERGDSP